MALEWNAVHVCTRTRELHNHLAQKVSYDTELKWKDKVRININKVIANIFPHDMLLLIKAT